MSMIVKAEEMQYEYKLAVFEGPLDLLLHLIEKHKIDIYDIPIVDITSQYMEQLEQWQQFDIHYSSEFLVMAATLLHIKSRMLLPRTTILSDGEDEDPRDELVTRLLEYKQIKELTTVLQAKSDESDMLFPRVEALSQWGRERVYRFELSELYKIFRASMAREHKSVISTPIVQVVRETFSIEETIRSLLHRLHREGRLSFYTLMHSSLYREEKVVTFIAVLELLKRQVLLIDENKQKMGTEDAYAERDVWLIRGTGSEVIRGGDADDTIGY